MKFTSHDCDMLKSIINTCHAAGIEAIIIEDGKLRCINEKHNAAIISTENLPALGKLKIGLSRLDILRKRLSIFGELVSIETTEKGDEISVLTMSSGKSKSQFRCTTPSMIKAPKAIDDAEVAAFNITKAEIETLNRAIGSMSVEVITLYVGKDQGRIELRDKANDRFDLELEGIPTKLSDAAELPMVLAYDVATLLPLLRSSGADGETTVVVGKQGTLTFLVNSYLITVIPQIGE
jgi:hypothetical protein